MQNFMTEVSELINSGILFELAVHITPRVHLHWIVNPLFNPICNFLTTEGFLSAIHSLESSIYSSKPHQVLRKNISVYEIWFPKFAYEKSGFQQTQTLKPDQKIGETFFRERDYLSFPLIGFVFITSLVITTSPDRDKLFLLVPSGQPLPTIFVEFSKRIRNSTTSFFTVIVQPFSYLIPENWQGTLLDPDYISSPGGFVQLMNFYQQLSQLPDVYVQFTQISSTEKHRLLPQLDSGSTRTLTALFTSVSKITGNTLVSIIKDNSFSNVIHTNIQLLIAVLNCSLVDPSTSTPLTATSDRQTNEIVSISQTSIQLFIIRLVTGDINLNTPISNTESSLDPNTPKTPKTPRHKGKGKNRDNNDSNSKNSSGSDRATIGKDSKNTTLIPNLGSAPAEISKFSNLNVASKILKPIFYKILNKLLLDFGLTNADINNLSSSVTYYLVNYLQPKYSY